VKEKNGEMVHKTWEESKHDPILIMHISGSTSKASNFIPIKPMKQLKKGLSSAELVRGAYNL
jgi:hypothetical protein